MLSCLHPVFDTARTAYVLQVWSSGGYNSRTGREDLVALPCRARPGNTFVDTKPLTASVTISACLGRITGRQSRFRRWSRRRTPLEKPAARRR